MRREAPHVQQSLAGVAELVDAEVSKTFGLWPLRVRFPPPAYWEGEHVRGRRGMPQLRIRTRQVSGHHRVLRGPQCGRGSRRYAGFPVDVLYVMIGGLRRDIESIGDLSYREPAHREAENVGLPT